MKLRPKPSGTLIRVATPWRQAARMLPESTYRSTILIIGLLWCVVAGVNLALSSLDGFHSTRTVAGTLTAATGLPLSLALFLANRQLRRWPAGLARAAVVLMIAVAGTVLWIANTSFQAWAAGHVPVGGWPGDWLMQTRMSWMSFTSLFVLQTVVLSLFKSTQALQVGQRQLVEARLAALRFQLNPHFLFNTLNAIATLVAEGHTVEAEEMISRLSTFLRSSLSGEPTDLITLATELETVQAYLDIEAVRFGDRLDVRYGCEPGLADALVPSFILQPLVENSVKYAVAPAKEKITIAIEASLSGADLVLVVEDDGRHAAIPLPSGTGVGLRNVANRLETLYGSRARVEAVRRDRGFIVVIRLPLRLTVE